ncbi:restriction endonuclease subunit S [Leptospirillum ferriphilum]|uniref:Restriction endonuclease subunit S n=1 Tax=Leptospirillum ferriphilum YSK TaxID=1441628 RepID=A0A059XW41_9BACT|nr:restriction endonuclease subunit S [Leptospirillum ferriphilum]AIA31108.1 restriction endonuclease subunit S [Leptospirillum ferriphilum YSK]
MNQSPWPPYPKYKDSGVEWLGKVPEHWEVGPFKWQIERNDGGVWGDDPDGEDSTIVLRSTEQTVDGRWQIDAPATRKLSESERASSLLSEGDLVVTKSSGSSLHIGKTTMVSAEVAEMACCYSNFMQRLRTKANFMPKLAWYLMNSDIIRLQFNLLSSSTTGLANLNGTMIGQVLVAVPPPAEQASITVFIDRETSRIDTLISEKERLISLLQEYRQALISHAVTKGLDPKVKMKDSGVEWLGEIPEHWEVKKLKNISPQITVGIVVEPSKYYVDNGVPALRSLNISSGSIIKENFVFISNEANEALSKSRLNLGDLVVVRSGQPGTTAVIPKELDGCNCIDLIIIRKPIDVSENYLSLFMNSDIAKLQVTFGIGGAIQQHFNVGMAQNIVIPLPPQSEQTSIVLFLDQETSRIDTLISESRTFIDLLKEYRSSLITAAVTGKIDVRGFTPLGSEKKTTDE